MNSSNHQAPHQESRALLAGVLSLLVLVGWYFFYGKKEIERVQLQNAIQASSIASQAVPPGKSSLNAHANTKGPVAKPETITTKTTPLLTMEWTSRGGRLTKVLLNKFKKTIDKKSPPIDLLSQEGEKATVLLCDGCNFTLPGDENYSLVSETDHSLLYEAIYDHFVIQKFYEWKPDNYLINLRVTLENKSGSELHGRLGIGWKAKQIPLPEKKGLGFLKGPGNQRSFHYKLGNNVVHGVKEEEAQVEGFIPWVGLEDRYFLISLISQRVSSDETLRLQKGVDVLSMSLYPSEIVVPSQSKQEESYSFYLGPKERESLLVAGVGLEDAVDYGWFTFLAIPILKLLQIFYVGIKNWGVAILLLTLLVKILMNPLTIKSMKQMKGMQKLQPKLAALKEKYKNDKQRLNMETMQLFKTHKVNPMGGCLPMVLQMPIYIALYKVLYNSIELYHAPFVGFYRDLSAPDPYFILPILLGVAMLIQQKLTPSATTDPAQKQMMMIMPIMFTAFMLFLPLGLVLYIFVNTATGVLQQYMSQKDITWRDLLRGRFRSSPA